MEFLFCACVWRAEQEDRIFWKRCSGSRASCCRSIQGRLNLLQVETFQIVWIKSLFFHSSGISSFFCPSDYLLLITVCLFDFFDRYKHNASLPFYLLIFDNSILFAISSLIFPTIYTLLLVWLIYILKLFDNILTLLITKKKSPTKRRKKKNKCTRLALLWRLFHSPPNLNTLIFVNSPLAFFHAHKYSQVVFYST
jgi:hypothetical protein